MYSESLIDDIVTQVMLRLQPTGGARSSIVDRPGATAATAAVAQLDVAVVTADTVAGLPSDTQRVSVPKRTIVTPAARDALKTRRIELTQSGSGTTPTTAKKSNTSPGRWVGYLAAESSAFTTVARGLQRQMGDRFVVQRADSTESATESTIRELHRGGADGVLLVSDRPEWAACLVNRSDRLRGCVIREESGLRAACDLSANVICLPHQGLAVSFLMRLTRQVIIEGGST